MAGRNFLVLRMSLERFAYRESFSPPLIAWRCISTMFPAVIGWSMLASVIRSADPLRFEEGREQREADGTGLSAGEAR
jgi:hypothetical protein